MAAWLRCSALVFVGAAMLAAGDGAAARGIAGEMGAQSRASVTITLSVAPRFRITPADPPGDIRIDSNFGAGRFTYRFVSEQQPVASEDDGRDPVILIVVPD